jgi:hypothetical protein
MVVVSGFLFVASDQTAMKDLMAADGWPNLKESYG